MNRTIIIVVLTLSLIFSIAIYGQAQTYFGLGAGISKITGGDSEYWNRGFNIGGELFRHVTENIQVGGRIAYNRICLNGSKIYGFDFSASTTIFEMLPSIRLITSSNNGQKIQFFGQCGAGIYISGTKHSEEYWGYARRYIKDLSENSLGLNFGAGIIIGIAKTIIFSIGPMYNIVSTEGGSAKYFAVNIAVLFLVGR